MEGFCWCGFRRASRGINRDLIVAHDGQLHSAAGVEITPMTGISTGGEVMLFGMERSFDGEWLLLLSGAWRPAPLQPTGMALADFANVGHLLMIHAAF